MSVQSDADAAARIGRMTDSAVKPLLDAGDLSDLVALAKRADRYRRFPSDASWEPTYDYDYAAAEGWRRKASRVAGAFSFTADGSTFNKNEVFDHCMSMAEKFANRVTVELFSHDRLYDAVPNSFGDEGLLP